MAALWGRRSGGRLSVLQWNGSNADGALSRVCVVTDMGADVDKRVAEAWAWVEAGLSRVLTASLRRLSAPAGVQAVDAVEAALAVPLPQDFRASLRVHNGADPGTTLPSPDPSPVPLECKPNWDDPRVSAYMVDREMVRLNGPVRPVIGSPGQWSWATRMAMCSGSSTLIRRRGERPDKWSGLMLKVPRGPCWLRPGRSCLSATRRILNCSRLILTARLWTSMSSDRRADGAAGRRSLGGCVRHGCWMFRLVIPTRATGRSVRPPRCGGAMNAASDARWTVSTRLTSSARWTGIIRVAAARPALTKTLTAGDAISRTRPAEVCP